MPSRSRRRPGGRLRSLARRVLVLLAILLVAAPVLTILVLRWVPPPTSAFMLQKRVSALAGGESGGGSRFDFEYRWTPWPQISPHAAIAVVAAEDQKFPTHSGFDIEAIEDAMEERQNGGRTRGASTISQQVAKNLFLWPGRSFVRKGLEAYLTVLLEGLWPKRRILEVYLNVAEMGPGTFGVGAASRRYFAKAPDALTPREAALLAAVLPNPIRMRAAAPSAYVQRRAAWIQSQMRSLGGTAYLEDL